MPIQILMPALSPTMTDGKLAKWLKAEGDAVAPGDVVAEIETDKATMEVEAVDEGVLGRILVAAGTENVPVNAPIAVLLEEGEDASALDTVATTAPQAAVSTSPPPPQPSATPSPQSAPPPPPQPAPSTPATLGPGGGRIFASPLARRLASDAGLDLALIPGTGPRRRIVKRDIEAAIASGVGKTAAPEAPVTAAATPPPATVGVAAPGTYTEVPNTTMRKVIARRLVQSKQEVPHFYLTIDCNIEALLDLRKQLNDRAQDGGYKLSVNDFIIKATAAALRRFPACNASWTDEAILLYNDVDISIAVATSQGLITPIVRKADQKGLAAISEEVRVLAAKARDGKLMPEEYQGGGFTISNLGMFGISAFSAIINPPQSCLLAVGAGEQRPIVKDGAVAIATMMSCTLSIDHRSVDGAVGAEFLQIFKGLIEDPLTLML